jgi:hypothetical protein
MGYRSDVQALIYPANGDTNLLEYNKLKLLMNTTFKDVYESWGNDWFTWDDKHRVLKFSANSVKWYDSYPEIERFIKFLAEVRDLEYEYEFIRIGEEDDDVEEDSTGDAQGFMYVSRTIEVNF